MSHLWKERRLCPLCRKWATVVPNVLYGGPVTVQVICESCQTFEIAEDLSSEIEASKVQDDILRLVSAASQRVNRAGSCLKIASVQDLMTFANDEKRLRERG